MVGVRRFPLFFIKVVIHLSDTTPDHFRSGNLHFLTAYFQFIYGFFVKAYFDVNVFWTIRRTPYFFCGHRTPPFCGRKIIPPYATAKVNMYLLWESAKFGGCNFVGAADRKADRPLGGPLFASGSFTVPFPPESPGPGARPP
ncbi:hypothetical protein, partial [uncultured Oscillibacter sp.]|uniref:hypothetical protein n=1 Tax=uncultured Oscillibacter sp. TaxID=876091 RepID=UPI00260214B3